MKNVIIYDQWQEAGWYEIHQPRTKFILGKNDKWQKADNGKQMKFTIMQEANDYLKAMRKKGYLVEFFEITTVTNKGSITEIKQRRV